MPRLGNYRSIDLTGRVMNAWTVIERAPSIKYTGSTTAMWLCKCICGKIKTVSTRALVTAASGSCGCVRIKLLQSRHRKDPKVQAFKHYCDVYKRNARLRNHSFELTDSDIKRISGQNCTYCGAEPVEKLWTKARRCDRDKYPDHYNQCTVTATGIDRLDNTQGYTLENSVPCCNICNGAKSDMTHDEWIAWLRRIRVTNYEG